MSSLKNITPIQKSNIPVNILLQSPVKLAQVNPSITMSKPIVDKNIHRPQLALAGFVQLFTHNRVQVFGNTEMYYLKSLTESDRVKAFSTLCTFDIPCIILTNNHELDPPLMDEANKAHIPIFQTKYETTKAIYLLTEFLDDQFAEQATIHGSFVDVYGVGVLLIGRSGIGKSEIALDLVERGHRLVADDIVMFTKKRESILMGTGTTLVKHFMEIRGLGIIDVEKMFGIRAIRFQKRLEIIVELEEWDKDKEYTRTGLDEYTSPILEVDIATVKLPIFAGKNITVITEVIALNYLSKTYGYNAAHEFAHKLQHQIKSKSESQHRDSRLITYFQSDEE
ncbi:MAG: HPr kinase/phosphorylase [Candidatus Kapabacteria bacterium]|jgi:HPr kinase/phosphorylase|nr:HPr kinase/phosphorylase [Candidatus Kapabacteria bacterium]